MPENALMSKTQTITLLFDLNTILHLPPAALKLYYLLDSDTRAKD